MVSRVRRKPDEEDFTFSEHSGTKGLESNSVILCPELKSWNCICLVCYNCEFGFNGVCDAFMEKVKDNPKILKELYRPVAELKKLASDSPLLGCSGKILSIGDKRDRRKKLWVLKHKLKLTIRFIPKFEEVDLPYFKDIFYMEGIDKPLTYEGLLSQGKSGDVVYSVNDNAEDVEAITLLEKLKNV